MVALRTVYAWELRKLVAQKRTYLGLGAAVLVPLIFVAALALQTGQPEDVPFGLLDYWQRVRNSSAGTVGPGPVADDRHWPGGTESWS